MLRRLLPVFFAWFCVCATSFAAQDVSVALLPGEGTRAPSPALVAELEATLAQEPGVVLIERDRVSLIIAENRLTAAGLSEGTQRVGTLDAVDLFVIVARLDGGDVPICRLVVIEAGTGISLAGDLIDEKALREEPGKAVALLRAALEKRKVPLEDRRLVAVAGIRNEDPGTALDGPAAALGTFLALDLGRLPQCIVLDRDRLEKLAEEETLSGVSVTLLKSAFIITGGIRSCEDPAYMDATVLVRSNKTGEARTLEFRLSRQDTVAARATLVKAMTEAVSVITTPSHPQEPWREALQLSNISVRASRAGDHEAAMGLAEAAYALCPNAFGAIVIVSATDRYIYALGKIANLPLQELPHALRVAIRGREMVLEMTRWVTDDRPPATQVAPVHLPLTSGAHKALCWFKAPEGVPSELQETLRELDATIRDTQAAYLLKRYNDRDAQRSYWYIWSDVGFMSVPPPYDDEYISGNIRMLANVFVSAPEPTLEETKRLRLTMLWNVTAGLLSNGAYRNEISQSTYQQLWLELKKNPDPYIQLLAAYTLMQVSDKVSENCSLALHILARELPPGHAYRASLKDFAVIERVTREYLKRNTSQMLVKHPPHEAGQPPAGPPMASRHTGLLDEKRLSLGLRGESLAGHVEGNIVYCLTQEKLADGKVTFRIGEWRLPDGTPSRTEPVALTVAYDRSIWIQTPVAFAGNALYFGTPIGLLVYDLKGTLALLGEKDGLPGIHISALTWCDGRLYLAFRGTRSATKGLGWYDPIRRSGAMIVSSAGHGNSELEGATYSIDALLADPQRQCVWIGVGENYALWGIWQFNLRTGEILKVEKTRWPPHRMVWAGNDILYSSPATGLLTWNPDTKTHVWLMNGDADLDKCRPIGMQGGPLILREDGVSWPAVLSAESLFLAERSGVACYVNGERVGQSSQLDLIQILQETEYGCLAISRTGAASLVMLRR